MKINFLSIYLVFFSAQIVSAQIQDSLWVWPEHRKTAEEKYALYAEMFNEGNYKAAYPPFIWLVINAPQLNSSLYINGSKIYDKLAENEKDSELRKVYQDSCLLMFDLRLKYFDEEANVLNRKAYYFYKFRKDDKSNYQELFDLFNRTFDLNKNDFWENNLVVYMDVIHRYKLAGGKVTDDDVKSIYEKLTRVIDYKISQNRNVEKLNSCQEQIDHLLASMIQMDCAFIGKYLFPRLKAYPDDLQIAKNIFKLAFDVKCTDSPAFFESARIIEKHEPNYGLAKLIGDRCFLIGDYSCALQYFQEALNLTDDNTKKAEVYLNQSEIYRLTGNKPASREHAQLCLKADPSKNECYNLIGNLYFDSFNDCKQGLNPVEDKAVYIAAYNMFERAGNTEMMLKSRTQFPSMEDIQAQNMKLGQSLKVGCWINEDVKILKRD